MRIEFAPCCSMKWANASTNCSTVFALYRADAPSGPAIARNQAPQKAFPFALPSPLALETGVGHLFDRLVPTLAFVSWCSTATAYQRLCWPHVALIEL